MNPTDKHRLPQLAEQAKNGSRSAMEEIYRITYPELYRIVRAMMRDGDGVADVLQETYISAFSHLEQLLQPEGVFVWLKRIAVRQVFRQQGKKKPLLFSELDADGQFCPVEPVDPQTPAQQLEQKEQSRLLQQLLAELPDGQRAVLILYYYEELSVGEISEQLGISQGGVKSQLHHGRKKLEKAAKALEAQGVSLRGMTPIGFLLALLREQPTEQHRLPPLRQLPPGAAAQAAPLRVQGKLFALTLPRLATGLTALAVAAAGGFGIYKTLHQKDPQPQDEIVSYGDVQPPSPTDLELLATDPTAPPRESDAPPDETVPDETAPDETEPDETQPDETAPPETEAAQTPTEPPQTPTEPSQPAATPTPSSSGNTEAPPSEAPDEGTDSGKLGEDLTWRFDNQTGVLTISGAGPMSDPEDSDQAWWYLRSEVRSVVLSNGITSIGSSAFWRCERLTSVTIPASVTSIGDKAFSECKSLTGITIPAGVSSIGEEAFSYCSSLTSVTIPGNATRIGRAAFRSCSALASVTLSNGVASIGSRAFEKCGSLTEVTIPGSVTQMGELLFAGSGLKRVTIQSGVTSIDSAAFSSCDSLTSVSLPGSVTSIGFQAFSWCGSLTSVTLPAGVTSLSLGAFEGCTGLREITVEPGNPSYSSRAGVLLDKGQTTLLLCPVGVSGAFEIPTGVTSIGNYAFSFCTSLTAVTIPSGVTSIGDYAFYGCSSLTDVTIPASVTKIGEMPFNQCSALSAIHGAEGSAAQRWAEANGIPFVVIP